MRQERVFPVDEVTRKGMVCVIEAVTFSDDPYRKIRMTIHGRDGLQYRLEGDMSPIQAVRLSTLVPDAHVAIHGVRATVEGRWANDWRLRVDYAPPGTRVIEGAVYDAEFLGMSEPLEDLTDDERAVAGPRLG